MQKKNNFKSKMNLKSVGGCQLGNLYLHATSAENPMAPNLAFWAKMFATGARSQDTMPKIATLKSH